MLTDTLKNAVVSNNPKRLYGLVLSIFSFDFFFLRLPSRRIFRIPIHFRFLRTQTPTLPASSDSSLFQEEAYDWCVILNFRRFGELVEKFRVH
ncbi:unnamed protein product [Arabis nemorensis]|uniref:Uncharacterized protein n=1 Tax=Arabis nemorensis TaxID=586526 RepID=A0A565CS13_9BRAS|nr:unnamed protein product [Arabis nemorensis]